jgi:hypothetical protein
MKQAHFEAAALAPAMDVLHIATSKDMFARLSVIETKNGFRAGFVAGRTMTAQWGTAVTADETFDILVPVEVVRDLLKSPPEDRVSIGVSKKSDTRVRIECGPFAAEVALPTTVPLDFLPNEVADVEFQTSAELEDLLVRVVRSVYTDAAAAANSAKALYMGVMFFSENGALRISATDGNRLSRAETPCPVPFSFTMTRDSVAALQTLLVSDTGRVRMKTSGSALVVRSDAGALKLPLIALDDTSVAAIDQVLSIAPAEEVVFNGPALGAALRRVRGFEPVDRGVFLEIESTHVTLSSASAIGARIGDASESIPAAATGSVAIKLYGDYIADSIRNTKGDVRLRWDDPTRPVAFEHVGCRFSTRHVVGLMR